MANEGFDLTGELEVATDWKTQYLVLTGHQPEGESGIFPRTYLALRDSPEPNGVTNGLRRRPRRPHP
jgi:hypothetical protein